MMPRFSLRIFCAISMLGIDQRNLGASPKAESKTYSDSSSGEVVSWSVCILLDSLLWLTLIFDVIANIHKTGAMSLYRDDTFALAYGAIQIFSKIIVRHIHFLTHLSKFRHNLEICCSGEIKATTATSTMLLQSASTVRSLGWIQVHFSSGRG